MNRAIFFDRDGVINYRPVGAYVTNKDEFRFIPDFLAFYKSILDRHYLRIVISNQQGVGKGIMSNDGLLKVHDYMQAELLSMFSYKFDDIYVCPALASEGSFRRKPNPGMILEAIEKYNIEPEASWMIGDSISDVIAGKKAGVNTILLGSFSPDEAPEADYIFKGFGDIMKSGIIM